MRYKIIFVLLILANITRGVLFDSAFGYITSGLQLVIYTLLVLGEIVVFYKLYKLNESYMSFVEFVFWVGYIIFGLAVAILINGIILLNGFDALTGAFIGFDNAFLMALFSALGLLNLVFIFRVLTLGTQFFKKIQRHLNKH